MRREPAGIFQFVCTAKIESFVILVNHSSLGTGYRVGKKKGERAMMRLDIREKGDMCKKNGEIRGMIKQVVSATGPLRLPLREINIQ